MDVDRNGVVWAALASGHLASFDRRKCRGPLNGPDATGQHCPEGWTFYREPVPQLAGVPDSGSAEASYYTWVDQFDTLGLGRNVPINTGNAAEGLLVLKDGKWVVLRVPYPTGFYTKWLDGRIDDPNGGWKGRALYADYGQNAVWHIEPGRPDEPETLYLGADPALLFRSDDGGDSWEPNRGILEHPTREGWFPGAGGLCCHSIQLDPSDPQRMYVGITSAGTFRSDDGGATWTPRNQGVAADFLPVPYPEVGQCVHKLLLHPARPERLWQQNHCGVYRSDDRGDSWERLDGNGLPSGFGFPIMLDPKDPDTAFVIPEKSFEYHYGPGGRLSVYRTQDKGQTWEPFSEGLPEQAWTVVLREASAFDADAVYFGTQSGSFFALADGDTWVEGVRHLPPILSVEAQTLR